MDLSRVFGDSSAFAQGNGPAATGNTGNTANANANNAAFAPSPTNTQALLNSLGNNASAGPQLQQAYEAGLAVRDNIGGVHSQSERLHHQVKSLIRSIESTRQAYEQIVQERDQMRNRLVSAEGRLGEVQKVVQRYTNVQEPVVASDGYTYERSVIQQYLEECEKNAVTPLSQLTKSELSNTLIPNQSLKKLVELLKTVKPQAVPPASSSSVRKEDANNRDGGKKTNGAANPPQEGRLHPCVRVYGFCNYKDQCTYAMYPYDACLSHLKGKCRFGSQCHELHVDYRGKLQGNNDVNSSRDGQQQQQPREQRDQREQREQREPREQQAPRENIIPAPKSATIAAAAAAAAKNEEKARK